MQAHVENNRVEFDIIQYNGHIYTGTVSKEVVYLKAEFG